MPDQNVARPIAKVNGITMHYVVAGSGRRRADGPPLRVASSITGCGFGDDLDGVGGIGELRPAARPLRG